MPKAVKVLKRFAISRKLFVIAASLAIVYIILAIYALPDAGLAWDESRHLEGGKARVYSIYAAVTGKPQLDMCLLDQPPSDVDTRWRCWSGRPRLSQTVSGFTWAAAWLINGQHLDPIASIAAHRFATVIFGALAVFFVFLFAAEAFGTKAGFFSAISLIFMPRFFAETLYVTLDAPAAAMVLVATYVFWKGLKSRGWGILAGVAFGLALASKINAYFLPFILLAWFLVSYRDRILPIAKGIAKRTFGFRYVPVAVYSFLFLSPVVFFISWPWLWVDTIPRYMELLATKDTIKIAAYYMGGIYGWDTGMLPWHYTWVMTAVTLPLFILIFAIIGGSRAIKDAVTLRNRDTVLILLGAVVPMLIFSSPFATPHDGVRIFLNVFPFIAILSGIGAGMTADFIGRRFDRKLLIMAVITLLMALPFFFALSDGMNTVAIYYSELTGGPRGAMANGLELDYAGVSYLDVVRWLNENAEPGAKIYAPIATNLWYMYKSGDIGLIAERFMEGRHGLNETVSDLGLALFEQKGILREDIELAEKNESDYYVLLNRRSVVDSNASDDIREMRYYIDNCDPVYVAEAGGAPATYLFRSGCA